MIKQLAVLCLGCGLFSSVWCAEWTWIQDHEGYRQEIDRESLIKTEKGVQIWDRVIPPGAMAADPEGFLYRYIITWRDYDCIRPKVTIKRQIYVGESARQVKEPGVLPQSSAVKSGSPKEKLWAAVCGKSALPASKRTKSTQRKPSRATQKQTSQPLNVPDEAVMTPLISAGIPILLPNRQKAEVAKWMPSVSAQLNALPVSDQSAGMPSNAEKAKPDCVACIACATQCRVPDTQGADQSRLCPESAL